MSARALGGNGSGAGVALVASVGTRGTRRMTAGTCRNASTPGSSAAMGLAVQAKTSQGNFEP